MEKNDITVPVSCGEDLKGVIKHTKKSGFLWIIILGAFAGVLLLTFGSCDLGKNKDKETGTYDEEYGIVEYQRALEEKICAMVSRVNGAGQVYAAVSLSGGFEYVYAQNSEIKNGTSQNQYIVIGSGSSETAVYLRRKTPDITGIGIICTGGDNPVINREIINLLSAAYGVGTNKIYVTGMSK